MISANSRSWCAALVGLRRAGLAHVGSSGWSFVRGVGRVLALAAQGGVSGVSDLRRGAFSSRCPLHVTLRVARRLPSLRARALFGRVQQALAQGRERFGFRLVQFSVQRDHLHLIVEASDRRALSRGMQGLSIRVARATNGELGRNGRVLAERYHARALTTPRAVRFALR